jgi:GNAT superfamily N-acetyltransferase
VYNVRNARPEEFLHVGELMVQVFSQLAGFPKESDQPNYYKTLANVGSLTTTPGTELLVAVSDDNKIVGAVVYFADMKYYGSGGIATQERDASGFRLLTVDPTERSKGIGKILTTACIQRARENMSAQLIIHTTKFMQTAWKMYEQLGFRRSDELDFMQGTLPVLGFRLML